MFLRTGAYTIINISPSVRRYDTPLIVLKVSVKSTGVDRSSTLLGYRNGKLIPTLTPTYSVRVKLNGVNSKSRNWFSPVAALCDLVISFGNPLARSTAGALRQCSVR